jgi:DNA-binding phage protein
MKKNIKKIMSKDAEVLNIDFREYYANFLKNKPKELKSYKKHVISAFNKTHDIPAFLEGLKTIAMAERKINDIAKSARLERSTVYKLLSKEANPSFYNVSYVIKNLGISLTAHITG